MKIINYIKEKFKKGLEMDIKNVDIKYYLIALITMLLFTASLLFLIINSGAGITKY